MNSFAWSITFKWNVKLNIKDERELRHFHIVKNFTKTWDTNIYFYWEIDLKSKQEILNYFRENISENIVDFEISLSSEDRIEILDLDEIDGEYSTMTISWIETSFEEVLESFSENEEVVCIRESSLNKLFWTKDIKVDIIP
jgi:hypothetical protein